MKTAILTIVACAALSATAIAQNVGIGTTTPGSSLTIAGSMGAGYRSVTASTTLTSTDYFVINNASVADTFILPAALAVGSGNFKGRLYKLKNNASKTLVVIPSTSEQISSSTFILLSPGTVTELISTGNTTGTTWEIVSSNLLRYGTDGIRFALLGAGCASCEAYDAAATDTWVKVTDDEFTAIQSQVVGAGTYGATNAQMAVSGPNYTGGSTTTTLDIVTATKIPASSYPVAFAIRTSNVSPPPYMYGLLLKVGTGTPPTATFTTVPSGGAIVTDASPANMNTLYYYVLKKPTTLTSSSGPSNIAMYTAQDYQIGSVASVAANSYYGNGDVTLPNTLFHSYQQIQVVATGSKTW